MHILSIPSKRLLLATILTWLCLGSVCLSNEDQSAKERVKRKIALTSAATAVRQALSETPQKPNPQLTENVTADISKNIGPHRATDSSKRLSQQFVERIVRTSCEEKWKSILKDANVGIQPPIIVNELREKVGDIDKLVAEASSKFVQRQFQEVFREARSRAVGRQYEELNVQVPYPSQESVDKALDGNPNWDTHRDRFGKELHGQIVPSGVVLFEENESRLSEVVGRVLGEVELQYHKQLDFVKNNCSDAAVPGNLVTSERIRTLVLDKLKGSLAGFPGPNAPTYNVFGVVTRHTADAAEQLERTRFETYLSDAPVEIESGRLREQIEMNLVPHRTPADCLSLLVEEWESRVQQAVVGRYVARAGIPEPVRPRIAAHFLELLKDRQLAGSFKGRVENTLRRQLPPIRESIAGDQVSQHFAFLERWTAPEELVTERHDKGDRAQPRTFQQALSSLRHGQDGLMSVPDSPLLIETEQKVVAAVDKRISEGVTTLREQLQLLRSMERTRDAELNRKVSSGTPKEQIIGEWKNDLADQWMRRGTELHSQHKRLFARTESELVKAVSKLYDDIKRQTTEKPPTPAPAKAAGGPMAPTVPKTQETRQAPAKKPDRNSASPAASGPAASSAGGSGGLGMGNGTGDGLPAGKKPGKPSDKGGGDGPPPDCTLLFAPETDGNRTRCNLIFSTATTSALENPNGVRLQFDPAEIDRSADQIVTTIWPAVEKAVQEKIRIVHGQKDNDANKPVPFKFHARVESDSVRHRMTILVRQRLLDRLEESSTVRVEWSDSL